MSNTWFKREGNVIKLVDVGAPNLCGHFKDGVLMLCDEVCGKKRGRRCKGDTCWWNEKVNKAFYGEKKKHTRQCVRTVLRRIRGGIYA